MPSNEDKLRSKNLCNLKFSAQRLTKMSIRIGKSKRSTT